MSINKLSVSVVMPAYQEVESISESIDRLSTILQQTGREFEIIVVADGCTDGTADVARSTMNDRVKVIDYSPNMGKGFATRQGIAASSNDYLVFMDADLDLSPLPLPDYFNALDQNEKTILVGSKTHPESVVTYPLTRKIASRLFKLMTRLLTGKNLGDTQTGMKAMRRVEVLSAVESCTSNGFSFDLELLIRSANEDLVIKEMPVILNFGFSSTVNFRSSWEAVTELVRVSRVARDTNA